MAPRLRADPGADPRPSPARAGARRAAAGGRRVASAGGVGRAPDSMPRAALLSIHARVEGTTPSSWEDPALVQLWGPRFSAYVIAREDIAPFGLGRLPDDAKSRRYAEDLAARLDAFLAGRTTLTYGQAGDGLGVHPNALRYAAATGHGPDPLGRRAGADDLDRAGAADHAARRRGSSSRADTCTSSARRRAAAFRRWAGIGTAQARQAFEALGPELVAGAIADRRRLDPGVGRAVVPVAAPARRRRRGSCPAATRTSCSTAPTASCSCPTPADATSSGPRASGRAPCSSAATSSACGGATDRT